MFLLIRIFLWQPLEEYFKRERWYGVTVFSGLLHPLPEDRLAYYVLIEEHVEQDEDKAGLMLHLVVERLDGVESLELEFLVVVDEFGEDGRAFLEELWVDFVLAGCAWIL